MMARQLVFPRCGSWGLLLAILICPFSSVSARGATPAEVDAAIEKAKAFIYSQQKPSGHWEIDNNRVGTKHNHDKMQGDSFGGFSSLATYALLAAGEDNNDPRIAKSIDFLSKADVIGIYSLGLRSQVWLLLPAADKRAKLMAKHDANAIISGMNDGKRSPENKNFWDYGNGKGEDGKGSGRLDHSVSQYGVLGLWAGAQNDVEIDSKVWEAIDAGWKSHQFTEGGWAYDSTPKSKDQKPATASMTAAGVATLFITEDMLNTGRGVDCKGNITNKNIEDGLAWMGKHFAEVNNNYSWYGVERIGVASGRKYFGDTDWYAEGAERLVRSQRADGAWEGGFPGATPLTATSFGVLFLVRGRAPIMMNKLQYDVVASLTGNIAEGNWNQRHRDLANLSHWAASRFERPLNFQIVNLKVPVNALHDAPILYISGDQSVNFKPEDLAKLREYVDGGGMIFANADCGISKTLFAKSIEALGRKLYPKYEFRDLPAGHVIYTNELFSKWKDRPRLRGLSNGVRELIVMIPDYDPARAWQTHADKTREEAFNIGADVFLYAIDKRSFRYKGEIIVVHPRSDIQADRTAKIARLQVGDNWDPEPGAWPRIAAIFHNQHKADLTVDTVTPGTGKLAGYKVAHLTGTTKFTLTPAARTELVQFVLHGGTLLIDAAGGSPDFCESAETELKTIFGKEAEAAFAKPLEIESPVFNLADGQIESVTYRDFYKRVVGKLKTPRLIGIPRGNRIAVFYSREDLTGGLVGEPMDGISGYSPNSATAIMRNIVSYGAFGYKPPLPKPTTAPTTKPTTAPASPTPVSTAKTPPPAK
ncbi:MAG: A-macroglobulin complement component [Phycisphaerales bacterium]|nr:A-macroglobulin complement component [Phycisphaerales bacterium]